MPRRRPASATRCQRLARRAAATQRQLPAIRAGGSGRDAGPRAGAARRGPDGSGLRPPAADRDRHGGIPAGDVGAPANSRGPPRRAGAAPARLRAGAASLLEYDLSGHHLGLVARTPAAHPLLRQLSAAVDGRLLAVAPNEDETWAWIGAR